LATQSSPSLNRVRPFRHCTLDALVLISVTLWSGLMFAQTERGSIVGRVSDSGGAVLWGATITLRPQGATTVSNEQGQFSFVNVSAGDYTVEVSYIGFS